MYSRFDRIATIVKFEDDWLEATSWQPENLWSENEYEKAVEELAAVRLKNLLEEFPRPYQAPYKSKPGEFLYCIEYNKLWVNGINFYDVVRAYWLGYLDVKFTVAYTLKEEQGQAEGIMREFTDIFGKNPIEGIRCLKTKLERIHGGKEVEFRNDDVIVLIRQSNFGEEFCYRLDHGEIPKIQKEEIYRGVFPDVIPGVETPDTGKPTDSNKGKKKRKQRTHLSVEKITEILKKAGENPGLTNIELGKLFDVSPGVFSKNPRLRDDLEKMRSYGRSDPREEKEEEELDDSGGMQVYSR